MAAASTSAWRGRLLAACAVAFALIVFNMIQANVWLAWTGKLNDGPRITSVSPGGAADRAGLRVGDSVDLSKSNFVDRIRFLAGIGVSGEDIHLVAMRDGKPIDATLRLTPHPVDWSDWVAALGALLSIGIATVLALRRSSSVHARVLCLMICAFTAVSALNTAKSWVTPSAHVDFAVAILSALALEIPRALVIFYASLFGRPLSRTRRVLLWGSVAILCVNAIVEVCKVINPALVTHNAAIDFVVGLSALRTTLAASLLPLLCLLAAFASSRGRERELLVWSTAMMVVLLCAQVALVIASGLHAVGYAFLWGLLDVIAVATIAMPFFMAYAVLNRRLLDIGFVINRAVVFAVVSFVMVAAFVLVEWALSEWMATQNHTENIVISGALALALGLSMRFVHHHIDNAVDRALFSKRRRDQDAMAAFATQAPYITDSEVLLERTRETLAKHADASHVHILLHHGRDYGAIDENDPACVALRAEHKVLDLHSISTAIQGEYAVPMVSRGRTLGIIVLGHKNSGESYAPDELAIVGRLAHSVALSLDTLVERPLLESMAEQLVAINRSMSTIAEAVTQKVMPAPK